MSPVSPVFNNEVTVYKNKRNSDLNPGVVYFDQRMHACTGVHMVENYEKRLKTIKKVLFSSYAGEAHILVS